MIVIPETLKGYVDFDNGKVLSRDLPKELEKDFKEFEKEYYKLMNDPKYKYTDF